MSKEFTTTCSDGQKVEHTCMPSYSLLLKTLSTNKIIFTILSYISSVKAFENLFSVSETNGNLNNDNNSRQHIKRPLL